MLYVKSSISSSTTSLLNAVHVSLVIALSLTTVTASSATQVQSFKFQVPRIEPPLSASSVAPAAIGPRLPSLEYPSWTLLQVTLPSESQNPWTPSGENCRIYRELQMTSTMGSHASDIKLLTPYIWNMEPKFLFTTYRRQYFYRVCTSHQKWHDCPSSEQEHPIRQTPYEPQQQWRHWTSE